MDDKEIYEMERLYMHNNTIFFPYVNNDDRAEDRWGGEEQAFGTIFLQIKNTTEY